MTRALPKVVGRSEIAEIAGVTPAAVGNWVERHADFPRPWVELRSGPIFEELPVLRWLAARKNLGDAARAEVNRRLKTYDKETP